MTWAPPRGFVRLDRRAWAALGSHDGAPPPGSPLTQAEWAEVYLPLAEVIRSHLAARSELHRGLSTVGLDPATRGPLIIGLAGSVAAGKSTCARALAAAVGGDVEVLSTDGFLHPNRILAPRNLLMRKGFPETYDHELIAEVLGRVAEGAGKVEVPRYSHEIYDITDETQVLDRPDVLIVEGINALASPIADYCGLMIYLDAAEPDVRTWYVERFRQLIWEAKSDPSSFFSQWIGIGDGEVQSLAEGVWEQVNLVNLDDHILPTRWRADIVLRKGRDHAVTDVAFRIR